MLLVGTLCNDCVSGLIFRETGLLSCPWWSPDHTRTVECTNSHTVGPRLAQLAWRGPGRPAMAGTSGTER
jgi:hypothetical protein